MRINIASNLNSNRVIIQKIVNKVSKMLNIKICRGSILTCALHHHHEVLNAHHMHPRYGPVEILHEHNIAVCLWSEDALRFYKVPTVLFELYLLVPDDDLNKSSSILSSSPGYRHVPPN